MVCVAAALKKEIDVLLDRLDGLCRKRAGALSFYEGSLAGRPIRVVRTGMGRTAGEARLLEGCSLFVSTGFCGGLSPRIARGDFVVSTAVLSRRRSGEDVRGALAPGTPAPGAGRAGIVKRDVAISPEAKRSIEAAAGDLGAVLHFGATFTADVVIRTPEEKTALNGETGALAVDMEDLRRLETAESLGVPFLSVRVVLDGRQDSLPSLRSALRIPSDAASLLKGAGLCARSLASLLARFVEKFEMA